MIVLLHKLAALFLLLGVVSGQTYNINIRDGDKICTQWILPVNGQFTGSFVPQQECVSSYFWDQANGQARLCCQGMPTTTSSTNFPKECGKQKYAPLKTRIIGGNIANANSWPWQIQLRGSNNLCGGTLIDEQHVLTAAHCINTPVNPSEYKVYIGAHETDKPMYMEQELTVSKVWVHEQYDSSRTANDVAVLRLTKPITISDTVNVICLPGAEAKSVNDTVWVSGWGRTDPNGNASPILKQTMMSTMGSQCLIYGSDKFSEQKQICAGKHGVGYTCQGDSGGPLMYEYQGQWFLNGVVSYGAVGCGVTNGEPAVFARVSYYLPWIRSKMASA